jgi:hypothetical protein
VTSREEIQHLEELHDALDTLMAGFFAEHSHKRPSITTVAELAQWNYERIQKARRETSAR